MNAIQWILKRKSMQTYGERPIGRIDVYTIVVFFDIFLGASTNMLCDHMPVPKAFLSYSLNE